LAKSSELTTIPESIRDLKLTPKQIKAVTYYVESGCKPADAAREAGYAEETARNAAHHLFKSANVIKAVELYTLEAIKVHAPRALATLVRLSTGAKSERVQMEASMDLLDRAGFKPPDRVQHDVGNLSINLNLGFQNETKKPAHKVIDNNEGGG